MAGAPDEYSFRDAGLARSWVVPPLEDHEEVTAAAKCMNNVKLASQGTFLLVQPDDSGMTYTGFWLLRDEYG
jgi:hypothetical protein